MKFYPKDFFAPMGRFIQRNGHWVALGLCLALMAGAAAWVGATQPPAEQPGGYDNQSIENPAPEGLTAGQEPDFVDRLDLASKTTTTPSPAPGMTRPVAGETLTAFSGDVPVYNATLSQWTTHNGVDIAGIEGSPVLCAARGTVTDISLDPLAGTVVTVTTGDNTVYAYAGLQSVATSLGAEVRAGEALGTLGAVPCEANLGAHLHLEVARGGTTIDPESLIAPSVK